MLESIDDVKIISSFQKPSQPYKRIQNRATHGFIYRIKGYAKYYFDDKCLTVKEGELIFLPCGSSYEYTTSDSEENQYTSINFTAKIENAAMTVYSLEGFHGAHHVFQSFSSLWKFGSPSDKYKCISDFYSILSFVSRIEQTKRLADGSLSVIEPAIEYLKLHIYDTDFKINKLHALCGISDTYFRKIFTKKYNMTPKEYVLYERITHARSIIESGDYGSIKEVAESVGYGDSLYFGKAFKKFYGAPPPTIDENN